PLQRNGASVPQRKRTAGSHQPAHNIGNQELSAGGRGADPRRDINGRTDEVAFLGYRLAGVNADTNMNRYLWLGLGLGSRVLQNRCAAGDRQARRWKGDEHGVAFDLDFRAGGFADSLTDEPSIHRDQGGGSLVPGPLDKPGVVAQIGKQERSGGFGDGDGLALTTLDRALDTRGDLGALLFGVARRKDDLDPDRFALLVGEIEVAEQQWWPSNGTHRLLHPSPLQSCELGPDRINRDGQFTEHLCSDAVLLQHQPHKDVTGPDAVAVVAPRFFESELDDTLHAGRWDDLLGQLARIRLDHGLNCRPYRSSLNAEILQRGHSHCIFLLYQSQEEVFRPNVRTATALSFLLGESQNAFGALAKSLEWIQIGPPRLL